MYGVEIKCAQSTIHGPDMCPEMCAADENDKVLPTNEGSLQYMRFCFYECKPINGLQTTPDAECTALTAQDLKYVIDPTGNAHDPALALVREAQAAAQAEKQNHATLLARNNKTDSKLAKLHAENAIKTTTFEAAVARDLSNQTRKVEQHRAEGRHDLLKKNIGNMRKQSSDADSVLTIHKAMMSADEAARNAGIAAQASLKSLKEGRNLAWQTAVGTGQVAMGAAKVQHEAFNAGLAAHTASFTNSLENKMIVAAEQAAAPYVEGFTRARQTMADYEQQAAQFSAKAQSSKEEADQLTAKANTAAAKGNRDYAEKMIKSAKETMERARNYAGQAQHFLATSEEINKGLPKYLAASRSAAARAAWELQPAWQGKRA